MEKVYLNEIPLNAFISYYNQFAALENKNSQDIQKGIIDWQTNLHELFSNTKVSSNRQLMEDGVYSNLKKEQLKDLFKIKFECLSPYTTSKLPSNNNGIIEMNEHVLGLYNLLKSVETEKDILQAINDSQDISSYKYKIIFEKTDETTSSESSNTININTVQNAYGNTYKDVLTGLFAPRKFSLFYARELELQDYNNRIIKRDSNILYPTDENIKRYNEIPLDYYENTKKPIENKTKTILSLKNRIMSQHLNYFRNVRNNKISDFKNYSKNITEFLDYSKDGLNIGMQYFLKNQNLNKRTSLPTEKRVFSISDPSSYEDIINLLKSSDSNYKIAGYQYE